MRNDTHSESGLGRLSVRSLELVRHKGKAAGYTARRHGHRAKHELIYVDYGGILLQCGRRRFGLKTGDCFLVRGGQSHSFRGRAGKPFDFLNIVYRGRVPGTLAERVLHLDAEERRLIMALKEESLAMAPQYEQMLLLKLNELFVRLERRGPGWRQAVPVAAENQLRHRARLVGHALGYLRAHVSRPLDVGVVCEHTGVSPSYLRALVRAETGMSLRQHLRAMRIEAAKHLLRESAENVTTTCYRVGYRSAPHFCTVFKRMVGMTPAEYARSLGTPSGP
ncbi:MAG: helix-turn-helix domain-containing protein [Kiritimatiellae bacterium]|nr:helix-turn-helix domain-containing protein [Kiritimatiellia bacterium]